MKAGGRLVSLPRVSGALLLVLASIPLVGCSPSPSDMGETPSLDQIAASARSKGHDWQADLLDDGDITLAEYDEGHRRNLSCLDGVGISYSEPERNLPDGYRWLYDMHWPDLSDEDGQRLSRSCYEENLEELELAMGAWGDWSTDPALLAAVIDCVKTEDFAIDESAKNWRDVWLSAVDQGLTRQGVAACVDIAMTRLYPGTGYAF